MLAMISLTFSAWWIPGLLTLVILGFMFRPEHSSDLFGMDVLLRLFWLVPLLVVWLVFFAIMYFIK